MTVAGPVAATVARQLARIAEREPIVHAWAHVDAAGATAAAERIDQESAELPLRGITVGIKDVIDTADMPTEYNSPIYRGHQPDTDAACVARLHAAGAVILGKTATTEFAHATPTNTTNPHDPAHTPGGSSSGAAAAVADGMVTAALGTQTGGSTIRPAGFCGVCAIKPTFGRIDTAGVKPLAGSLDTVGLFAGTIADLQTLFAALTEPADPAPPLQGVAICRTEAWDRADPAVQAAVLAAAAALGVPTRDIDLPRPLADLDTAHQTIMAFETAAAFAAEWRDHRDQLSDGFASFIAKGQAISPAAYDAARDTAQAARAAHDASLGDAEVIVTPSTVGEAPRGFASTGDPVFNRPWTLLHAPCVHMPWGRGPGGLPIGVQFVGRRGADAAVLAAAQSADTAHEEPHR